METKLSTPEIVDKSERTYSDIAVTAIDQIIVNGHDRAKYGHLIRAGYGDRQVDVRDLERFFHSVENDERFIEKSIDGYYHFDSRLSEGSTVVPDIAAVVRGQANCCEEVRNETLIYMESLVEKLLGIFDEVKVINIKDIEYALEVDGATYSAFLTYIKVHPRFEIGKGLVYIKDEDEVLGSQEKAQSLDDLEEKAFSILNAEPIPPHKLWKAILKAGKGGSRRGKRYRGHHQRFRF